MRLSLPVWAQPVAGTEVAVEWLRELARRPAEQRFGVLAAAAVDDCAAEVRRILDDLDPLQVVVLAPPGASAGLAAAHVVGWTEHHSAAVAPGAVHALHGVVDDARELGHVSTGLDEALVVRRERQLQAVIPERGTGRALVLTWSAFGDVGWAVHEQAFAAAVASASSSATVDLSAR